MSLVRLLGAVDGIISIKTHLKGAFGFSGILDLAFLCRNLLSIDSRLNQIDPSTNIFLPNPEQGYRTKLEILLEEVFPNIIE